MNLRSSLLSAVGLLMLASCESADPIIGEWETVQGGQAVTVTFSEDSTFVMDFGDYTGEGTYSVENGDLFMTPTGTLAASVPAGFTGTVDWQALTVCSPGGMCSDFEKVD